MQKDEGVRLETNNATNLPACRFMALVAFLAFIFLHSAFILLPSSFILLHSD